MASNPLTATEIVSLIQDGHTTPVEVMIDCLERIKEREPLIGAFAYIDHDTALDWAHKVLQNSVRGALFGVPFVVKDIIDCAGVPISYGSQVYSDRTPTKTAACVQKLVAAGGIPVGISVSTEFACFTPGKTVNPHNREHTPGGSSSGTAAAVADGMVPVGLGSQTAASLIRPASYCGVFAYKASQGYLDLNGVMELVPSLDSLGAMTRSTSDLQRIRSILRGDAGMELTETQPSVAFMPGPNWERCNPDAQSNCLDVVEKLKTRGLDVDTIDHPPIFTSLTWAHKAIMARDITLTRKHEYEKHRSQISEQFAALFEDGLRVSTGQYSVALTIRKQAQEYIESLFDAYDTVIAPATSGEAPRGLNTTGDPLFSRGWTLLQLPAVSIPCGQGDNGLPLSIQALGRKNNDTALINHAEMIDSILHH